MFLFFFLFFMFFVFINLSNVFITRIAVLTEIFGHIYSKSVCVYAYINIYIHSSWLSEILLLIYKILSFCFLAWEFCDFSFSFLNEEFPFPTSCNLSPRIISNEIRQWLYFKIHVVMVVSGTFPSVISMLMLTDHTLTLSKTKYLFPLLINKCQE